MSRVLIAYDGSECSEAALRDLARAGMPAEAEAVVMTVADGWTGALPPGYPPVILWESPDLSELSLEDARAVARKGAEKLSAIFPRWSVGSMAVADSAAEGILAKIEEWKPDFVATGSHGRSAAGRLLFGSVSQKILTQAHCNLRICRGRDQGNGSAPLRIVVAYDGSQESEAAFETVLCRHWSKGTAVRVVTVLDMRVSTAFLRPTGPMRYWTSGEDKDPVAWVGRMLSYQKNRIEEKGLIAYADALKGDPKRVLLKEAEKWGADVIFAGCRGLTGRERVIAGSVSAALATHAHCSVEVVHRLWNATACCEGVHEEHRDCMTRESGRKSEN